MNMAAQTEGIKDFEERSSRIYRASKVRGMLGLGRALGKGRGSRNSSLRVLRC